MKPSHQWLPDISSPGSPSLSLLSSLVWALARPRVLLSHALFWLRSQPQLLAEHFSYLFSQSHVAEFSFPPPSFFSFLLLVSSQSLSSPNRIHMLLLYFVCGVSSFKNTCSTRGKVFCSLLLLYSQHLQPCLANSRCSVCSRKRLPVLKFLFSTLQLCDPGQVNQPLRACSLTCKMAIMKCLFHWWLWGSKCLELGSCA